MKPGLVLHEEIFCDGEMFRYEMTNQVIKRNYHQVFLDGVALLCDEDYLLKERPATITFKEPPSAGQKVTIKAYAPPPLYWWCPKCYILSMTFENEEEVYCSCKTSMVRLKISMEEYDSLPNCPSKEDIVAHLI